jgi:hypothetical protein
MEGDKISPFPSSSFLFFSFLFLFFFFFCPFFPSTALKFSRHLVIEQAAADSDSAVAANVAKTGTGSGGSSGGGKRKLDEVLRESSGGDFGMGRGFDRDMGRTQR